MCERERSGKERKRQRERELFRRVEEGRKETNSLSLSLFLSHQELPRVGHDGGQALSRVRNHQGGLGGDVFLTMGIGEKVRRKRRKVR